MTITKVHLGDGVYVCFDGFALVLTTEDGYHETNRIFEPAVWEALKVYATGLEVESVDEEAI